MTANQGFMQPTRRPGELGIHSLDHFHFVVPDLDRRAKLLWRIRPRRSPEGKPADAQRHSVIRTSGARSARARARSSAIISFGAFEDDIDRFAKRLQACGVKRLDPPPGTDSNGLWFHDHDGNLIEIKVAAKSSPNEKTRFAQKSAARGRARRTVPQHTAPDPASPPYTHAAVHRATSPRRSSSTRACSACGCPTIRATTSRLCTASTAAITT